jgi:hypothetical protein
MTSAAAFRVRTCRVSILRACATSVCFVLRLFAKTRNLTFFLSSAGFLSHDNSDEASIKYFEVLQEYIYIMYRGADKSLALPGRKQATATEDFDVHISYLLSQLEEY